MAVVPLIGSVGSMGAVWAEGVRGSLDESVELLGAVIQDCPDDLWCAPMWRVQPSEIVGEVYDNDGIPITDAAQRDARIQRWSHPWSVARHAWRYSMTTSPANWLRGLRRAPSRASLTRKPSPACPSAGRTRRSPDTSIIADSGFATRWAT